MSESEKSEGQRLKEITQWVTNTGANFDLGPAAVHLTATMPEGWRWTESECEANWILEYVSEDGGRLQTADETDIAAAVFGRPELRAKRDKLRATFMEMLRDSYHTRFIGQAVLTQEEREDMADELVYCWGFIRCKYKSIANPEDLVAMSDIPEDKYPTHLW